MGSNGLSELSAFVAQHRGQLEGAAVPELYWPTLHAKLAKQQFDAGDTFTILQAGRLPAG
jgi:hypothetical protein